MREFNEAQALAISDMGKQLLQVKDFLHEGMDHGTVVEAMYYALKAALTGEAQDISEALYIGASEWYK
jgi:hypothetical protein